MLIFFLIQHHSHTHTHTYIAIDATECTTGQHNCTENATCMEEVGFFRCVCPTGYQIDEDTYASCKGILYQL